MSSPFPVASSERNVTSTTVTTTTTTTASPDKSLYMNVAFIRTYHGYIKILEIIACLLAFICVMSTGWPFNSYPEANFISFVTVSGLIFSSILLFLYFINAVVYFTIIPWILMELIYSVLWCFFCFVGGIVGSTYASKYTLGDVGYAAAAFFLFLGMCIYGYAAFKLYLLHRQGVRLALVTTEVSIVRTSTQTA